MTGSKIPFFGLKRQYANIREEILGAIDRVYRSGQVLDGHETQYLEHSIAQQCGRQFAVAVNSGTQALIFAQQALNIHGKVLIPTQSFIATLNSVILANNYPRFIDVDSNGLMDIDLPGFDSFSDGSVHAVMYVNLYGNVIDYNKLKLVTDFFNPGNDVKIIEDAAQSFGASYQGIPSGKLGDVSVLSFDPTKNLPNYGSGGMILTDDAYTYANLKDLRDNGKYTDFTTAGTNSKISESDAACLLIKLKYFEEWQRRRTAIAEYYTEELKEHCEILGPNKDVVHAWHKFVVKVRNRDYVKAKIEVEGIETKIHYETPLPEYESAFDYTNYAHDLYAGAREHSQTALSLPIYPELTDAEVEAVVKATRTACILYNSPSATATQK
jgi:dTDP-4-amino-4,6-dideoxygalactose transaminase